MAQKSTAKRRRPHSLSHGRPTSASTSTTPASTSKHLAARHTRRLIRSHHTLQKQLAAATRANDTPLAASLRTQLDAQGGLEAYQAASATGADKRRGGDTSIKLLEFLAPHVPPRPTATAGSDYSSTAPWSMLDVGAVSCDTAAARSGLFSAIERIDLRSRERGIREQDFMQRPLPRGEAQRFDVVCLSLVLNYVPDARGRGEMLKRAREFLKTGDIAAGSSDAAPGVLPALFLVLPAPCVLNSRYLNEELLGRIMASLGFVLVEQKVTAKLAYYLWRLQGPVGRGEDTRFAKAEVNAGKSRNNFVIVL